MLMYYALIFAKLGLGLVALILQINLLGKGNLAPTSATDQVQNYVLGGIIGGVIYNDAIGIVQFLLILISWTLLIMLLKFLKMNHRQAKIWIDGKPVILIEKGVVRVETCMRYGVQAYELHLKLRTAGVYRVQDVKRAVLEQNGQLTVVQYGEQNIRFPLVLDGQMDEDVLELIGRDAAWLGSEIARQGYTLRDVYIAEYVEGRVVMYPYVPHTQEKPA